MKNKKIFFGILLGVLFLTVVGTTYAYFNLTTSGNDNASGVTIYDAKLHLTYEGGSQITGTTIEPSNTTPIGTKTIEITNDGTESVYYLLHWKELYNELIPVKQGMNDLVTKYVEVRNRTGYGYNSAENSDYFNQLLNNAIEYGSLTQQDANILLEYYNNYNYIKANEDELYVTATCTSYINYGKSNQAVSGTCEGFTKDISTQSTLYTYSSGEVNQTYKIKGHISIASGITHVYSVSVYFRNEEYNQNYNQNKQFYGSIGVSESDELVLPTPKASLSAYSWAEIKQLSDALVSDDLSVSELSETYNIALGDTTAAATITTTGGYDSDGNLITTSNEESHTFKLIGIKHDVDENGKTLGMTFEQTDLLNDKYVMKSNMTSTDSWANSDLRAVINNFTIQSDLNNVITPAKKESVVSVVSELDGGEGTLEYLTSKLWLMSITEIYGIEHDSMTNDIYEGKQYEYYATQIGTIEGLMPTPTEANRLYRTKGYRGYWLRTANSYHYLMRGSFFYSIPSDGGYYEPHTASSEKSGISLCFCI